MAEKNSRSHVKILFEIERDDGAVEVESLWARKVANGYEIDNIPFYAKSVAYKDIVSAQPDADGLLRYSGLVTASGHSTVRLWVASAADVPLIRGELRKMGCSTELDLSRLVSVDIPPSVAYAGIRSYLEAKEASGVLEYEEACLGQ